MEAGQRKKVGGVRMGGGGRAEEEGRRSKDGRWRQGRGRR